MVLQLQELSVKKIKFNMSYRGFIPFDFLIIQSYTILQIQEYFKSHQNTHKQKNNIGLMAYHENSTAITGSISVDRSQDIFLESK